MNFRMINSSENEFYKSQKLMKKAILAQRSNGLKRQMKNYFILLFLVSSCCVSAQSLQVKSCDYDISQPWNYRFVDTVEVVSTTGELWQVSNSPTLYNLIFPSLHVNGTFLTETPAGSGIYRLIGRRSCGGAYDIEVSRVAGGGVSVLDNGSDPSSTDACTYPMDEILGDLFICPGDSETYQVTIDPDSISSFAIAVNGVDPLTLSDGNTYVPGPDGVLNIDWVTPGTYTISMGGITNLGCPFDMMVTVEVEANIALACNNSINVTSNGSCEIVVDADMLLEDPQYENDSYTIEITDNDGNLLPGNVITADYIGQQLTVKVIHTCGQNSCWGIINVEDKTIPLLECGPDVTVDCDDLTGPTATGFPLPASYTGVPVHIDDDTYLLPGFDNCGDAYITWTDELESTSCTGPFGATITRKWTVTDENAGSSTCSTTIQITRSGLADIMYPDNWDDVIGPNPTLEACPELYFNPGDPEYWEALPNGHPDPEYTGYPTGLVCFNVNIMFDDTRLDICGDKAFKILRRWIATDWCTSESDTMVQYITVMDRRNPIVSCGLLDTLSTDAYACGGDYLVPNPFETEGFVVTDCSDVRYEVSYLQGPAENPCPPAFPGQFNAATYIPALGRYSISDLVAGCVWVRFTFIDACGNVTECTREIVVEDDVEPVPVCDQYSFVAINDTGMALASWETFDDGSYDNCSLHAFEVERMTPGDCEQPSNTEFVKFCCEDVGTTQMVQLTVWDASGNSNFCMVEVEVQDVEPPMISCPKDLTLGCTANLTDLSIYGTATATDNCGFTMSEIVDSYFGQCGNGYVTRTFTATDYFGNTARCTQTLTLTDLTRFNGNSINWPNNYDVNGGCTDGGTDPDDLPFFASYPRYNEGPCSNVAYDYDDIVFQFVDEACLKILRKWTVIDWCQFNPFLPGSGQWTNTQVIKVFNNVAPTITEGCDDITPDPQFVGTCDAHVTVTAIGEDDCTTDENLEWSHSVDYNNDGDVDYSNYGNDASGVYPFGTHEVCWSVEDDCGNVTECCQLVTVRDNKPPTPYCYEGIITVIMETTSDVTIWASDFYAGASDNCPGDVETAFSDDIDDKWRTYSCDDLGANIQDTFELKVYFFDEAGNSDFCTTMIIIQDNQGICPFDQGTMVAISGGIFSENHDVVSDVEVSLMRETPDDMNFDMTESGEYTFSELAMYSDYTVSASHDVDYLNGVSTLDLLLIQKHILNIKPLDSPYKLIAADVNSSESISAIDLIDLRKLILGVFDELPKNSSYRFVDGSQTFTDPLNPFPFTEEIEMESLDHDVDNADFVVVKIGDVNASADFNFSSNQVENRSKKNLELLYSNKSFEAGENFDIEFSTDGHNDIHGLQFTLEYNPSLVRFNGISSDVLDVSQQNYSLLDERRGVVTFSWNTSQALNTESLFNVSFEARNSGEVSDIVKISSNVTSAEAYLENDGRIEEYNILLRSGDKSSSGLTLYQNVPNPFDQLTTIGFELNQDGHAVLKVYDISGRLVFEKQGEYPHGYNEIILSADDLGTTGILYYQLQTDSYTAGKKMISIK